MYSYMYIPQLSIEYFCFSVSSDVDFFVSFIAVTQKGHNDNFWRDRISYSDIWAGPIVRPVDVYVFSLPSASMRLVIFLNKSVIINVVGYV